MILKQLISIKPQHLLDVGCGSGSYTSSISPYCDKITAIDPSEDWLKKAIELQIPNATFELMDAKEISFPDNSFDIAIARGILHHIENWQKAIDQMIRVTKNKVLIEEPFDDLRSESRLNTYEVQQFFLELQKEIGYQHFNHSQTQSVHI